MKLKRKLYWILALPVCIGLYLLLNKENDNELFSLYPRSTDSNLYSEYSNAMKNVDFYRERIERNPDDPKNYVELAQIFFQEARITGKHHEYLPKIMNLVESALKIDNENLDANLTKGALLLNLHKFEEAEQIGEWGIKKYPYSSAGYGILVDAYIELGKYENAINICDKMLQVKPDIRSYSRASYIREIHGDMPGAIEAMRMAADAGVFGKENRAWVLCNLANLYMQMGKIDTASFIYNGILDERPNYAYAFSGIAKVMAAKGDLKNAEIYLIKAVKNLDDHSFLEQLADLYLASGNTAGEEKYVSKVLDEFKEHENTGWNIDREYAQFCLNHNINLEESLVRAEREYRRRERNLDVIDTYAWALYKNNRREQAYEIIKKAFQKEYAKALTHYHAAVISSSLGKQDEAVRNLELALNKDLSSQILFYRDAKSRLSKLKELASIN